MRLLRACLLAGAFLFLLLSAALAPAGQAQGLAGFRGEYFNNLDLSGPPALVRDDPAIQFEWGSGPPAPGLPNDGFSVRWTRWYDANPAGQYIFTLTSDDGSRLWVDGDLVTDMWYDHDAQSQSATLALSAGYHLIRVEYYDRNGSGLAKLDIAAQGDFPDWKGEYFDNPDLAGSPVRVVNDPQINFSWGVTQPDITLPADDFSVRWTRSQYFEAGSYRFTATTDDGMRVWVGKSLLIDEWHDQPPTTYTADIALRAGVYLLRVEYYDATGSASAKLSWASAPPEAEAWTGQYFNNPDLSGTPALVRKSGTLAFTWGANGPGANISGASFSAKWDATRAAPAAGFYTVYATADDGVRVSVDGKRMIDEWRDQSPTQFGATVYLAAGPHKWHVEYYQHLGSARLSVQIVEGVAAPPVAARDIVVEDGGMGWLAGGNPADWRASDKGSGKHSSSALNEPFATPLFNWARWYPSLPEARNYQVSAYIPAGLATTRSARYWIAHAGTLTVQSIAQASYKDEWVSLGTYYFNAMGGEYVLLSDVTYECSRCYTIAWDAVKFTPQ